MAARFTVADPTVWNFLCPNVQDTIIDPMTRTENEPNARTLTSSHVFMLYAFLFSSFLRPSLHSFIHSLVYFQVLCAEWLQDFTDFRSVRMIGMIYLIIHRIILFPFMATLHWMFPWSQKARSFQTPINKYLNNAASYFVFLALILTQVYGTLPARQIDILFHQYIIKIFYSRALSTTSLQLNFMNFVSVYIWHITLLRHVCFYVYAIIKNFAKFELKSDN